MLQKVKHLSESFQKALELNKEALLTVDVSAFPQPNRAGVPHPFGQIFHALKHKTIEVLNKNHYVLSQVGQNKTPVYLTQSDLELVQSHVMTTISAQTKTLEKNLFILSTIVTLAPFMGLLGTVWGILISFSGLQGGGSVTSNSAILGGLSTALATTVMGLVIAIPALVAYNYFKNALRVYGSDMDDFMTNLLSTIELQYKKVE
jgi:biopolymer transport protein TolQ